jgi:hypothetical protein
MKKMKFELRENGERSVEAKKKNTFSFLLKKCRRVYEHSLRTVITPICVFEKNFNLDGKLLG